ncbi:MAG: hypothetical protein Q9170_006607 [Blastenia crenularia]
MAGKGAKKKRNSKSKKGKASSKIVNGRMTPQAHRGIVLSDSSKDLACQPCPAVNSLSTDSKESRSHSSLTLDKLPAEIQRLIYVNLLKADYVRQPPDEHLVRLYKFYTAILLVNKRITDIAHRILYQENYFVVVSCNFHGIYSAVEEHGIAAITKKPKSMSRFKQHIMRVHVVFPWAEPILYQMDDLRVLKKTAAVKSFLTIHHELQGFVRLLQTLSWSNYGCTRSIRIVFQMNGQETGPIQSRVQKLVLEPFRQLSVLNIRAKILGGVNADYTKDVVNHITSRIKWTRGTAWQMYDVLVSIVKVAEEAVSLGKYDLAFAKYGEYKKLHHPAFERNERVKYLEDSGLYISRIILFILCDINMAILKLQRPSLPGAAERPWLLNQTDWINPLPQTHPWLLSPTESLACHYKCISKFLEGDDVVAFADLRIAAQLDIDNGLLAHLMNIMWKRTEVATATLSLTAGWMSAVDLGFEILLVSDPMVYPSENIASERYVLRKLGYKGNMLPLIAEKKAIDIKTVDKILYNLKKQKERVVLPLGEIAPIWVDTHEDPFLGSSTLG